MSDPKLTDRQRECLRLIAEGETSSTIATALGLSTHTIDHYVRRACEKLNARSRTHAVAIAIERNLLGGPIDRD